MDMFELMKQRKYAGLSKGALICSLSMTVYPLAKLLLFNPNMDVSGSIIEILGIAFGAFIFFTLLFYAGKFMVDFRDKRLAKTSK